MKRVRLCEHGQIEAHSTCKFCDSRGGQCFLHSETPICPGGVFLPDDIIIEKWEGEKCNQCGKSYADVYSLPDEIWARIHERAPAGLLCPACALGRAVAVLDALSVREAE